MTDFFAELEGHLHRAARRRAARARALPVATLAVIAALAVVAVAAIGRGGDPEVAAPGPTPPPAATGTRGDCRSEAVPAALLGEFAVLRRRDVARAMPERLADPLTEKSARLDVARVWTTNARRVSGAYASYWIVPALVGRPCGAGGTTRTVGACVVSVEGTTPIPSCRPIAAIRRGGLTHHGYTRDGRGFVAALVPDGFTFHVELGGRRENGMVTDNIGEKAFGATNTSGARVFFQPLQEGPAAPEDCFTVSGAAPDPRIADLLPMFAKVPLSRYGPVGGEWLVGGIEAAGEGATGVHTKYTRTVGERGGWRFSAAPARQIGCGGPGRGPGACVVASSGDGAATERRAWCWTLAEIEAGEATAEVDVGPQRMVGFELRSGRFAAFCADNPGACEDPADVAGGKGSFVLIDP